jgi:hypothetical protein
MLKPPGLADRRCRGQRIIHPEDDVVVAVGRGWVEEPDAGRRDG